LLLYEGKKTCKTICLKSHIAHRDIKDEYHFILVCKKYQHCVCQKTCFNTVFNYFFYYWGI